MEQDTRARINDFALKVATINGTGSASANGLLMQAIFRMGVPVSGKNVFPSNIQGLPTWYEIRVNKDGYDARASHFDIMVAMNPKTYEQDITEVRSGGFVLYDSTWPIKGDLIREDVTYLGVPLARMCVENFDGSRERILMTNIAYVGALAAFLKIDLDIIQELLKETFKKKPKLVESNEVAIRLGYEYATGHFECPLPFYMEHLDCNVDHVLMTGNTSAALGCVYAGATVGAWYPITPATSVMDSFKMFCSRFRKDPETGENLYCVIQAEDELAAIGMVLGASWMGARAFTPTSGAGISLMNEFIGLAYYAEVPAVLFDIQRTGPSTGMPTRTQQGDFFEVAYASHGDTKHLVLFPAEPRECFYMAVEAFDLAERFQTPVFLVSDLDIGMNDWICKQLEWDDDYVPDRGKVLSVQDIENIKEFYRYMDVDGDGIPYRTLPGVHPDAAYFTRGSGHDRFGRYTEDGELYKDVMDRIARKIDGAADYVPDPEILQSKSTNVGIVTVGSCRAPVLEAIDRLAEAGVVLDYMRVRGFPFSDTVNDFLESHDINIVIEQNRDAQFMRLLFLETGVAKSKFVSVRDNRGSPMTADFVIKGIQDQLALIQT